MPFINSGGDLVIPFDGPERYHYWKPGGQSLKQTLAEVSNRQFTQPEEA